MIGFFQTFEDLRNWARGRAQAYEDDYRRTGNMLSLGYAMAMRDIVRSEMGADIDVPAYQREVEASPATIVPIRPVRRVDAA
ncbi:MAG: hypothetical protein O3B31_11325 [Chloroflexi bacterium]|nr:hypothetical protein [Chloroflexota bacterium]